MISLQEISDFFLGVLFIIFLNVANVAILYVVICFTPDPLCLGGFEVSKEITFAHSPFRRRTHFLLPLPAHAPIHCRSFRALLQGISKLETIRSLSDYVLGFSCRIGAVVSNDTLPMLRRLSILTHLIQEVVHCRRWSPRNPLVNDRSRA